MFSFNPFPHIKHVKSFALDFEPGHFCCQHKIDGANFSVYLDLTGDDDVKFYSRNLPTSDRFFNSKEVEAILKKHVLPDLGDFFKSKNYYRIQLYGELYGEGITSPIKYEAPNGWNEAYSNLPPCTGRRMQYFTCFDIKHWVGEEEVYMDPEAFHQIACEFRNYVASKCVPDIFLPDNMMIYTRIGGDGDVYEVVKEMCTRKEPEFRGQFNSSQDLAGQLEAIKSPPIEGVVFKNCRAPDRFKYVLKCMRDTGEKGKVIKKIDESADYNTRALVELIKANITRHRCEKRARDERYDNWGKFALAVIGDAIEEQCGLGEQMDLGSYSNEFINCVKKIFPYPAKSFYAANN